MEAMRQESTALPQAVLLGLLMQKPRHGYELYQEFCRDLGRVWHIGLSQLYAQLKQLEEAGLVAVHVEPQPSRPARKVYHLTAEGREVFLDWVHEPTPNLRRMRVDFMARLYFFRQLCLPGLAQLVAQQKAVCQTQIEKFNQIASETDDDFRRLVLEFRRGQLEAAMHWLDRCLEILCR
jgi:PadR family transcriptional regulator, phenolic acid-responsive transcriptional regulator